MEAVAPTATRSVAEVPQLKRSFRGVRREIAELERRMREMRREIAELRAEIAETRRLQQRVAELTDLVAEVLVPVADRDDARVQKALETFARTSF